MKSRFVISWPTRDDSSYACSAFSLSSLGSCLPGPATSHSDRSRQRDAEDDAGEQNRTLGAANPQVRRRPVRHIHNPRGEEAELATRRTS